MRRLILPALACLTLLATMTPPAGAGGRSVGDGVLRGDLGPASGTPMAVAGAALQRFEDELGIEASDFSFDAVRRSIVGLHIRGAERRGGVTVAGTSAAVHVIDGRVVQVEARPSPLAGSPVAAPVDRSLAVRSALAAVGIISPDQVAARRMLVPHRGRLVDAFRVTVFSMTPAIAADVDVAAHSGRPLVVRDSRVMLDGTATVFDPNPVVTKKDKDLRTPGVDQFGADTDLDSEELTAELQTLPVKSYELEPLAAGKLLGPYVEVQGPAPLDLDGVFEYTRGDPRFETTMAYTHIDRFQRYTQSLGFAGDAAINAEPQDVYTLPVLGFDNSFYQPTTDIMLFGAGGVDDAEDAEVILHELGHAIHDAQVPGWGSHFEGGAMGEGWGDFLAAAYYAREQSGGFQDECVADWDATSYSDEDPPCLRRTDRDKRYPDDVTSSVHSTGEIWSAFLWTLRSKLRCPADDGDPSPECGEPRAPESMILSDRVLKLVLASHELLTPTATFADAVAALILAADGLGHPDWVPLIEDSAAQYGLPLG